MYNPNTKAEQLKTLSKLAEVLAKLHLIQKKYIICVRDINLLFDVIKLENYVGNPVLKKPSDGKIFELKESQNLTNISRIRNLKSKQYTFW